MWNGRLTLMCTVVLGCIVAYAVGREWWARRDAHATGVAACVARGHDGPFCAGAVDKNDEECFPGFYRPPSRSGPRRFDATGYAECIEVGPDAYYKAIADRIADGQRRHAQSLVP